VALVARAVLAPLVGLQAVALAPLVGLQAALQAVTLAPLVGLQAATLAPLVGLQVVALATQAVSELSGSFLGFSTSRKASNLVDLSTCRWFTLKCWLLPLKWS
jgi:hypothetical protein